MKVSQSPVKFNQPIIKEKYNMWQVMLFKLVMTGLRSLAKNSENKIDDEIIEIVDRAVPVKEFMKLF